MKYNINKEILIEESNALTKRKNLQQAGVIPYKGTPINLVNRTITNNKGEVYSGKELDDARQKLGALSNNEYQKMSSVVRKGGGHREILSYAKDGKYQKDHIMVGGTRVGQNFRTFPPENNFKTIHKEDIENGTLLKNDRAIQFTKKDGKLLDRNIPISYNDEKRTLHSHPTQIYQQMKSLRSQQYLPRSLPSGYGDPDMPLDREANLHIATHRRGKLSDTISTDIIAPSEGQSSNTRTRIVKRVKKGDNEIVWPIDRTIIFNYDKSKKYDLSGIPITRRDFE